MPPKLSKAAGEEALEKGTAQPIGSFFKAQKKAGRPKAVGNLTAVFQAANMRDKATAPATPAAPATAAPAAPAAPAASAPAAPAAPCVTRSERGPSRSSPSRAVTAQPTSPAATASHTHASCHRLHSPRRSRRGVAASGTSSTANTSTPDRPSAVTAALIYVTAGRAMKPHREARGFNEKLSHLRRGAWRRPSTRRCARPTRGRSAPTSPTRRATSPSSRTQPSRGAAFR